MKEMKGMTVIVKKAAQLISGIIFLYGVYIVTHGHLTPGGGFAGGAIITGAFVLIVLAFGDDVLGLKKREVGSSTLESAAILVFLIIASVGLFLASSVFFLNFLPPGRIGELLSAGVIPLCNIAVGIEVAAALLTIFLALVIHKEEGGA